MRHATLRGRDSCADFLSASGTCRTRPAPPRPTGAAGAASTTTAMALISEALLDAAMAAFHPFSLRVRRAPAGAGWTPGTTAPRQDPVHRAEAPLPRLPALPRKDSDRRGDRG
ncbi:hypothetical protein GCM10010505_58010 [Kitasatospora aburaviensis]